MKRKITTILLALALCLTLLPVGAGAASTTEWELKNGDTTLKYGNGTQYYDLDTGSYFYYDTTNACYVLNGGTYYLNSDVTIDKPLLIKGTATLDLKGHVLEYRNSATNGSVIIVNDGAHFTLTDSDDASYSYTYKVNGDSSWTNVAKGTGTNTITLTGGVITGGTGTNLSGDTFGGGVYVGGATFTMTGGNIVGCTATSSGGVHIAGNRSFTMTGGSIVYCTAKGNGNGVYVGGTMDAQGGSVYSSVYIENGTRFILKNTSAEGSTIFYPDTTGETITKGNKGKIEGKRVTFMNGDDTYAETLAGVSESESGNQIIYTPLTNAKISAPVAPSETGKTFLGWVIDNPADTSKTHCKKFDFTKDTVTTDLTLYAAWDSDFEVEVSDAQNNTDGYYKSFATAWDSDTGARGDGPTFKLLKDVNVDEPLSYSKAGATLDLNGHEFSGNIAINGMRSDRGYQLTLTSSADNGNFDGTVTAVGNLAQLKVKGGTVKEVVVGNGGTLDCIGGKITTLTVNGGTVTHTGGNTLYHDDSNHWKICTVCGNKCDNAAHSGGTATCKELAKCAECQQPYGSKDPANHTGTLGSYQHDKDGHWQVYSCCNTKVNEDEHSFGSDGKCVCGYEKPRRVYRGGGAPSISAVLSHPDAASATNYTSGIYGLTFRSTASFSSFRGVQVDGKTIASSNYIAEEGSIVVYLKAVYLQTLPNGTHTVTILSTEGNATMDFTIGAVQSAKTGDAGVAIYALMALTSYTGTALVVRGRKRK